MLNLFQRKQGEVTPPAEPQYDAEGLILAMARHGKPRIFQHDDGQWACTVDVHVKSMGTSLEVKSGSQKTLRDAIDICLARLYKVVQQTGEL